MLRIKPIVATVPVVEDEKNINKQCWKRTTRLEEKKSKTKEPATTKTNQTKQQRTGC
jgi:hypothetical protein